MTFIYGRIKYFYSEPNLTVLLRKRQRDLTSFQEYMKDHVHDIWTGFVFPLNALQHALGGVVLGLFCAGGVSGDRVAVCPSLIVT